MTYAFWLSLAALVLLTVVAAIIVALRRPAQKITLHAAEGEVFLPGFSKIEILIFNCSQMYYAGDAFSGLTESKIRTSCPNGYRVKQIKVHHDCGTSVTVVPCKRFFTTALAPSVAGQVSKIDLIFFAGFGRQKIEKTFEI